MPTSIGRESWKKSWNGITLEQWIDEMKMLNPKL
jgi:hypothetical protein